MSDLLEDGREVARIEHSEVLVSELDHPAHVGAAALGGELDGDLDVGDAVLGDVPVVEENGLAQAGYADVVEGDAAFVVAVLDVMHLFAPGRCIRMCRFRGRSRPRVPAGWS